MNASKLYRVLSLVLLLSILLGSVTACQRAQGDNGKAPGNNSATSPLTVESIGAQDGWILEADENSTKGGTMDAADTTFFLGDDATDRQYRAILAFDTSSLPDKAVITKLTLKIKREGIVGTNPLTTHMGLKVDINQPQPGPAQALAIRDFQAKPGKLAAATFNKKATSDWWYSAVLGPDAYPFVNLQGMTTFRLRFAKDDNDNMSADYLRFYSGNAAAANRPVLVVEFRAK